MKNLQNTFLFPFNFKLPVIIILCDAEFCSLQSVISNIYDIGTGTGYGAGICTWANAIGICTCAGSGAGICPRPGTGICSRDGAGICTCACSGVGAGISCSGGGAGISWAGTGATTSCTDLCDAPYWCDLL